MYSTGRRERRQQQSQNGILPATGSQSAAADTQTKTGYLVSAGALLYPTAAPAFSGSCFLCEASSDMHGMMPCREMWAYLCPTAHGHLPWNCYGCHTNPWLSDSCLPLSKCHVHAGEGPSDGVTGRPLCQLPATVTYSYHAKCMASALPIVRPDSESRWPPRMVERMEAFLALASAKQLTPM